MASPIRTRSNDSHWLRMRFHLSRHGMKKPKVIQFLLLANRNARIGEMCLGLIACLMMSPFVFFARSYVQYILEGERIEARIVASPTVVRTKFSTRFSYPVEYQDVNGKHRSGVGLLRDASLDTGDMITMCYLRSDPARSWSEEGFRSSWPTMVFALIAVFVLAASLWNGGKGIRDILGQLSENATDGLSPLPEMAEPSHAPEPAAGSVSSGTASPPAR